MSGSYLSGEKGAMSKGGAPGRPPKRSNNFIPQGFKVLPTDQGAFDLYGGLNLPASPVNDSTQGMSYPVAAPFGPSKASPRMLPIRTTRRFSAGNQGKSLRGIDK